MRRFQRPLSSTPAEKKIDTLVVNGAECEPYLTSDHRLMAEHSVEIVDGVRFLKQVLGVGRVVIGIEDNKPGAIRAMAAAARNLDGSEVVALETKYPQGGEKQVIKAVLDREVPSGASDGRRRRRPERGNGLRRSRGRPSWAPSRPQDRDRDRAGHRGAEEPLGPDRNAHKGPDRRGRRLQGRAGARHHGRTDDGIGRLHASRSGREGKRGVLVLHRSDTVTEEYRSCIRCASCVNACPMGLMPNFLSVSAEALNFDEGKKYHPYDCIECGCCDYVCPSRRPIAQHIRFIKTELRKKAEKAKAKAA